MEWEDVKISSKSDTAIIIKQLPSVCKVIAIQGSGILWESLETPSSVRVSGEASLKHHQTDRQFTMFYTMQMLQKLLSHKS